MVISDEKMVNPLPDFQQSGFTYRPLGFKVLKSFTYF